MRRQIYHPAYKGAADGKLGRFSVLFSHYFYLLAPLFSRLLSRDSFQ
jgi:hypothetical protein